MYKQRINQEEEEEEEEVEESVSPKDMARISKAINLQCSSEIGDSFG